MTEENKIELLEAKLEVVTQKLNEVISCLEDNELTRKLSVEYLYPEDMQEEEEREEEEAEEEAPVEEKKSEAKPKE